MNKQVKNCLQSLAGLFLSIGLPPAAAAALALLIAEGRELTLTEIAIRAGYAKSHVSTHLRALAANGLVECRYVGRRVLYRASRRGVIGLLKSYITSLKTRIDAALGSVGDTELKTTLSKLSEKLAQLIAELSENEAV